MNRLSKYSICLILLLAALLLSGFRARITTTRDHEGFAWERQPQGMSAERVAACTPITPDLISYWPMNDAQSPPPMTIEDAIGTNPGTCVDAKNCPSPAPGKIKAALEFDGNDRVSVADSPSLNFDFTDSFSIEAWIKTSEDCTRPSSAPNKVVIGEYNGSLGAAWWLGCGADDPGSAEPNSVAVFSLRASLDGDLKLRGETLINDDAWHYVVAVHEYDGANPDKREIRLYVDGVLENAISTNGIYTGMFSGAELVTIGYYQSGTTPPFQPGYHFTGPVDELAIYGRSLTIEEIQDHYNGGAGVSICFSPYRFLPVIIWKSVN